MTTTPTLGAMRQRLTLEVPQRVPDGAGGFAETWLGVASFWALIESQGGSETFAADKRAGRITHAIVARTRPDFAPARRLRLGARVFEIRAVVDADVRRRRVRLLCEERDL